MIGSAGGENGDRDSIKAGGAPQLPTVPRAGGGPGFIKEGARQFEEETEVLERIASRLKPFATGRASPVDYDTIKSSGLPRASEVFFLVSAPQPVPEGMVASGLLMATTICDAPFSLHTSIAAMVVDGSLGAGGLEKKPLFAPSFERLARLYGYAGVLIHSAQQDPKILADDIVHVWSQWKRTPPDLVPEVAAQVATQGPDALDKISLNQPTREAVRRLFDRGVPVSLQGFHQDAVTVFKSDPWQTAWSKTIEDAEDLLTEIGVFWLLGFRWRWCAYRRSPHWYITDYRKQYSCVRHQDAVQQQRFRRAGKRRSR